jgi:hypothetical protein
MSWIRNFGDALIKSVSFSIGGGLHDWCNKCHMIRKNIRGEKCGNIITSYIENNNSIKELLNDLFEENNIIISENEINQYIENKDNYNNDKFKELFNKIKNPIDECECYYKYNNLYELLKNRYEYTMYDKIESICDSTEYQYVYQDGIVIDKYDSEWNNLMLI